MKKLWRFLEHILFKTGIAEMHDITLEDFLQRVRLQSSHPILQKGYRVFSQLDEDGIIQEIFTRIGIAKGVFLELGVGDGTENNTLNLCSKGWRGYWLGGQELVGRNIDTKINFKKTWITKETLSSTLFVEWNIEKEKLDFVSIDVDGNDYYFAEVILERLSPTVLCVEYNGLLDSDTEFVMNYVADHKWGKDWYFGASALAWVRLLRNYGYTLICCSLNGTNAFFVRDDHLELFSDCKPGNLKENFIPQRNYLFKSRRPIGRRLFESIIEN